MEAITFTPGAIQPDLKPIAIAGNPEYWIDPTCDDFFKRLIQLRITVKKKMKGLKGQAWTALDVAQEFLKILANSTAYGISVQIDPADFDKREYINVFGPRERPHRIFSKRYETPGPYFHPLLGAVTTSAARLMLAITEQLIIESGLDWAFCDTDSMAIAKPDEIAEQDFQARVEAIRSWFILLNPYGSAESLLKLEDANFSLKNSKTLEPLYCYAISSKRYALFSRDEKGRPILRKASAHGLGHLRAPNDA
jgi:DNA polymerase elongation subunit (family B)